MVKKILSSIILIMIICSTCVCANDVIVPEDIQNPSQEQETINPDDNTTSNDSEDQNTNTGEVTDTNTGVDGSNGENSDVDNNTNTGENTNTNEGTNTGTENNENTNNDNQNEANNNNQTGSNVEQPSTGTDTPPIPNNPNTTTDNVVAVKSSEARLKELKVDALGLTPDFDKNTTEYYLIVDLSVNQIKVTAEPVDSKAKVTISGNKKLKEGENTITISVTAEDGTLKKYYIYVTKIDNVELANAELEGLEIQGFNVYPNFKSNIYSYNLDISKNVKELNITAIPQRENAKIEIEGNTNLQEGENLIKIIVTAEDGTTIRTYKINTYIDTDRVEVEEESKLPAVILILVLGTCIIAIGIFIVVKNRR